MPLLGTLASSPCVLTKDVRIWICDHCTDREFNMYFPLLPSISTPLALLLSAVPVQNQPSSLSTSVYAVGRGISCVVSILRVACRDMTLLICKYRSNNEVFLHAERPK